MSNISRECSVQRITAAVMVPVVQQKHTIQNGHRRELNAPPQFGFQMFGDSSHELDLMNASPELLLYCRRCAQVASQSEWAEILKPVVSNAAANG